MRNQRVDAMRIAVDGEGESQWRSGQLLKRRAAKAEFSSSLLESGGFSLAFHFFRNAPPLRRS
jgi:hypothetical protein